MKAQPDQMRLEELPMVLHWAAREGWNPGLDDAAAFFATDPAGFFVARVDDAPVAAISVVNHSDDFAFLGLYICLPAFRGQGIGKTLWDHALAHAGDRTIGLDAVPAQRANYEASGFKAVSKTTRFDGLIPDSGAKPRPIKPADLAWIIPLDEAANGYAKRQFLQRWTAPTDTRRSFVLEPGLGFATIRKCNHGAKIGPLLARNTQAANDLMRATAQVFDGPTIIDLPEENAELAAQCVSLGMAAEFHTIRMYRGPSPVSGLPHHSTATLELG